MRSGLIARLRERGVLRVAASYAVIAWLLLQIADVALEPWDLPGWVRRAPLVIAVLGFPIAIALAWFFELGDGAVSRDAAVDGATRPVVHGWRRHADIVVISVLGAAVAYFVARDAGWLGDTSRPGSRIESSSLAVMPFASVGAYSDQHVSDGLSDELRNQFSRMQSLQVTARSSSIAFQGQALDAMTIASKLAVAVLLEGTVGRGAGRLQVSVQLINGRDGKVMWAERYDRPDDDLLAMQTEIANAVVAAVLPRFAASGQAAPPPPTEDPVAYDLYLLGRQKLREGEQFLLSNDSTAGSTAYAQAADLFGSAIAADPKFAQAYASRAYARLTPALSRTDEASNELQVAAIDREVMPDIERALELDPKNADAYFTKGRLLRNTNRAGAEDAYRRAVELDPSHSAATLSLGYAAMAHGRLDERHRLALRALDLDPMDLSNHEGAFMSAAALGRAEEVRRLVERMRTLFPDNPVATGVACYSWSKLGKPDDALACYAQARSRFADNPPVVAEVDSAAGAISEALGDNAQALRFYERAGDDLQVKRMRRDVPALQRVAAETLAARPSTFQGYVAHALAQAGLTGEALAVYEHAGTAELMSSDQWFKVFVVEQAAELVALLRLHGDTENAEQLLRATSGYAEALRSHGSRSAFHRLAFARVYALQGRNDDAIEQLSLAVDALDSPFSAAATETALEFHELAGDPRFKAQMQRLRERQAKLRAQLPETFGRYGLDWPPK